MKKEWKKRLQQSTAAILTFLMVFTSIHWGGISLTDVFAAGEDAEEVQTAADVPVSKSDAVLSENTVDSTTFDLGNGQKKIVLYGSDVRYEDEDGNLRDYDPSLKKVADDESGSGEDLSGYLYENKAGDKKHYLPETLSEETPVLLENGGDAIRFAPASGSTDTEGAAPASGEAAEADASDDMAGVMEDVSLSDDASAEDNAFSGSMQEGKPALEKETVEDAYEQEAEKNVTAVYDLGEGIRLSYRSMENGVKETILLDRRPDSNVFTFELSAGDLVPEVQERSGAVLFTDPVTGEEKAVMAPPSMDDASGEAYSEAITCGIEEKAGGSGTYLLTYTVDDTYLSDPERQYPVSIDPTLTWTGTAQLKDVYVCGGSTYKDMNFYNSDIVITMAGKAAQGVYRSYMKFMDLTTLLDGYRVDSAALTLYEASGSQSGQTIEARRVTGSWVLGDITWNTQPSCNTKALSSVTTSGTTGKALKFELTQFLALIQSGKYKNYGLLVRNKSESASFGKFYGTRNSTSARRPKLTAVVSDKPVMWYKKS